MTVWGPAVTAPGVPLIVRPADKATLRVSRPVGDRGYARIRWEVGSAIERWYVNKDEPLYGSPRHRSTSPSVFR